MNFDCTLKGFECMVRAIEIVYLSNEASHGIVKNVYIPIALELGTTPQCVERNCRTLIKARWLQRSTKSPGTLRIPRIHNGKIIPPVKEFICFTCAQLSIELSGSVQSK